jgi:hypothetical protein
MKAVRLRYRRERSRRVPAKMAEPCIDFSIKELKRRNHQHHPPPGPPEVGEGVLGGRADSGTNDLSEINIEGVPTKTIQTTLGAISSRVRREITQIFFVVS